MSSNLDPNNSPNQSGDNSVRRLNKLPLIFIGTAVGLVLTGIFYALQQRQPQEAQKKINTPVKNNNTLNSNQMAQQIIGNVGDGLIKSKSDDKKPNNKANNRAVNQENQVVNNGNHNNQNKQENNQLLTTKTNDQAELSDEEKHAIKLAKEFNQRNYYEALVARTAIETQIRYNKKEDKKTISNEYNPNSYIQSLLNYQASLSKSNSGQTEQQRKEAFANENKNPYHYLNEKRTKQLAPYEIKVGSIIPAIMISGINSDLPSDIIAQVSQDVRDSRTGRKVLIPQGSKLIGRYDSQIAFGQKRLLISWYRLQFPDASVLNLNNMGAVDLAGYAGMKDRVNNHTIELFANAFLLSVINKGTSVAIAGSNFDNAVINGIKNDSAKQFGQIGSEIIKRNMDVKPTLEIRAGYRFNVMVNKDIILEPYE